MKDEQARDRELLLEQVCSAWRPRDRDGRITGHPAWHDLSEQDRLEAFRMTEELRRMEAALDRKGLSGTARAVMERISNA